MSKEGEKSSLVPSPSSALARGGAKSIVQRGLQDLIAGADADEWRVRGATCFRQREFGEALDCFRRGLQLDPNNDELQFLLGGAYFLCVPSDPSKGIECYRRAGELGNSDAEYCLGCCFWEGLGTSKSYEQAARWWRKAAEQGHVQSTRSLGLCYEKGLGVALDRDQAARLYREVGTTDTYKDGVLEVVKRPDGTFDLFFNRLLHCGRVAKDRLPEELCVRFGFCGEEYDSILRELDQAGRKRLFF